MQIAQTGSNHFHSVPSGAGSSLWCNVRHSFEQRQHITAQDPIKMTKLVVIIGITGNQGSSVASTFLQNPSWRIRGLTRDTQSPTSRALSARGVEMVQADLHIPHTLRDVFKDANLVFSVTDFWTPFFKLENQVRAKELGKSTGRYAYELEVEQGQNIVDALARHVDSLDNVGFVASTLCNARKSSKGKYQELWHFDSKADVFPDYVVAKYPELAKKTSYLHTGYYFTSWQILPGRWFAKVWTFSDMRGATWSAHRRKQVPGGAIQMQFPTNPDSVIPHLDSRKDTGPYVEALLKLPPNSTVLAASEWCTWPKWIELWGNITGVETSYKQVDVENFDKHLPGGVGKEIGEMFEFSSKHGYNAEQADTLKRWDLEEVRVMYMHTLQSADNLTTAWNSRADD
jgi:hypothetical protein